MRIPSKKQCYQLIYKIGMLDHIVIHSILVCRVATILVDNLKVRANDLNRNLVQASALLHDITKTKSFKTKENHAHTGNKLLSGLGYPEVGYIVGQHIRLDEYDVSETPTEVEIVNYADKRVVHDKVVSLKERMNYILDKYGKEPEFRERIFWLWRKTDEMEERLFNWLPFSPDELNRFLKPEDCSADFLAYREACV